MEAPTHDLAALFAQLGLENSQQSIDGFINKHAPLNAKLMLHQASFWSESQSQFLKESIDNDADWADVVNHLDTLLRN
ncbi:DUF2789 domain-containing protein [Thiomicrorhabdus sp. Kp2]|uniref:DUF2789 domain-containing protein n=1 Tax=Thiomicrorhabdus sp. Kp2 TaxID=1123518 RepID=UPI00041145D0|nr:DUF2789 domain-containing protein [Thiomicrorhabdus sp. Kp2]